MDKLLYNIESTKIFVPAKSRKQARPKQAFTLAPAIRRKLVRLDCQKFMTQNRSKAASKSSKSIRT